MVTKGFFTVLVLIVSIFVLFKLRLNLLHVPVVGFAHVLTVETKLMMELLVIYIDSGKLKMLKEMKCLEI